MGYSGAVLFNLLCAFGTAWGAASICRVLGSRFAPYAALFTVFMPLYFVVILSGLTEPLFGLVLISAIRLTLTQRYFLAASLISFLPFVRTEGFFLVPLFGVVLLLRGRWKALPLLAAGTIIYSVVGGLINDDFLWVLNGNPYIGAEDIYGRGPPLHFVRGHKAVLGTVGLALFVAGGASTVWRLLKERREHAFLLEEGWLILGCFSVYLGMHSIFWHYGLFGSLGLLRVMAAVSPLGAIAIVRALDKLQERTVERGWVAPMVAVLAAGGNIYQCLHQKQVPFRITNDLSPGHAAARYIRDEGLDHGLVLCFHPYILFKLDRDPFDAAKTNDLEWANENLGRLAKGTLLVWDSHFGPGEEGLQLQKLVDAPSLELVKAFKADHEEVRDNGMREWPAVYLFRAR